MTAAFALPHASHVDVARAVLAAEAAGLRALSASLDQRFADAVDRLILNRYLHRLIQVRNDFIVGEALKPKH